MNSIQQAARIATAAKPVTASSSTSGATSGGSPTEFAALTSDDQAMLFKMTGYMFTNSGTVSNPDGKMPPWNIASQIGADRMRGTLSGDVTPDYLKNLFAQSKQAGQPYPTRFLDAGLDYLEKRQPSGRSRPIDTLM
jgi:hypothetical protein